MDETEIGRSGMVDFENIFNNVDESGAKYMIVEVEGIQGLFKGVQESYDYLNEATFVEIAIRTRTQFN